MDDQIAATLAPSEFMWAFDAENPTLRWRLIEQFVSPQEIHDLLSSPAAITLPPKGKRAVTRSIDLQTSRTTLEEARELHETLLGWGRLRNGAHHRTERNQIRIPARVSGALVGDLAEDPPRQGGASGGSVRASSRPASRFATGTV